MSSTPSNLNTQTNGSLSSGHESGSDDPASGHEDSLDLILQKIKAQETGMIQKFDSFENLNKEIAQDVEKLSRKRASESDKLLKKIEKRKRKELKLEKLNKGLQEQINVLNDQVRIQKSKEQFNVQKTQKLNQQLEILAAEIGKRNVIEDKVYDDYDGAVANFTRLGTIINAMMDISPKIKERMENIERIVNEEFVDIEESSADDTERIVTSE